MTNQEAARLGEEIKRIAAEWRAGTGQQWPMLMKVELHEAIDRLVALASAGAGEWRPIESAPKDGTVIGVWSGREPALIRIVRWGRHLDGLCQPFGWITVSRSITISNLPTHWMPIAAAPLEAAQAKEKKE